MEGKGIIQFVKDNSIESSEFNEEDFNNWMKQIFTGNTGSKKRWFIFYGSKKQFKSFMNIVTGKKDWRF
jgi:hypothetical protein